MRLSYALDRRSVRSRNFRRVRGLIRAGPDVSRTVRVAEPTGRDFRRILPYCGASHSRAIAAGTDGAVVLQFRY